MFAALKNSLTLQLNRCAIQTATRGYAQKAERFKWCQQEYAAPKAILADGNEMPLIGLGTWMTLNFEAQAL